MKALVALILTVSSATAFAWGGTQTTADTAMSMEKWAQNLETSTIEHCLNGGGWMSPASMRKDYCAAVVPRVVQRHAELNPQTGTMAKLRQAHIEAVREENETLRAQGFTVCQNLGGGRVACK
jgi:hypothetical protein